MKSSARGDGRRLLLWGVAAIAPPHHADAVLLDFSADEVQRISRHGPWPPPRALDAGNARARRSAAIELGQRLFFDARLSIDGTMSCASCHAPVLAFADGRALASAAVALDRNAPSLWNAVHERWYGWDGAADSMWSQAIRPILDAREMAASAAMCGGRRRRP